MTKSFRRNVCLVIGALGLAVSSASADVIYNNSANDDLVRFQLGNNQEAGDEILLTSTGWVTNFAFEYFWIGVGANDPVQARVQFYRNNGPVANGYASPGTSLFDSGWFGMGAPTARGTMNFFAGLDFPVAGLFLPVTNITWTVTFRNLTDDQVGLDVFTPPSVSGGNNTWFADYWFKNNNDATPAWALRTNSIPMEFASRFEANIPEPSSLSLLLLGGLGFFAARRNRK